MKTKLLLFLAVAAASASLSALAAELSSTETRKADLKVDPTPVAVAGSGTVLSYADMIEPVQKAVVSVYSTKIVRERVPMNPFLREFFGDRVPERETPLSGMGSGVVVTADGYIITNNHVIEDADELKVLLPDEREFKASVVGADPKTDIAIIKIEAEGLPHVTLADSDLLRVGDVVFAVGNPLGVGQTVTMGVVSAKGRSIGILEDVAGYEDFIQTDAAINQGNSGGALVDARGRLVGINSAILSPNRGSIGIGFAVPVNLAANIMRSLIETGRVARGYLGVAVEPITSELAEALGLENNTRGVMVTQVTEGSPAEKAGLERSDAILSVNNRPVASLQDLRLYVSQLAPGTEVAIKLIRGRVENPDRHPGCAAGRRCRFERTRARCASDPPDNGDPATVRDSREHRWVAGDGGRPAIPLRRSFCSQHARPGNQSRTGHNDRVSAVCIKVRLPQSHLRLLSRRGSSDDRGDSVKGRMKEERG